MCVKKYNELVRNRKPESIEKSGIRPINKTLDDISEVLSKYISEG